MRPRILFVYQLPSPFILQDRDLLAKHARVREFRYSAHRHPARALSKWMLTHGREFDLVFVWFGDAHASVATRAAKLLGKPSVLVIGGYDLSAARGYGFLSTTRGVRMARGHFQRATLVLAVSSALRDALRRHFPVTEGKTSVLPTGVDVHLFRPGGPRTRSVLSVAGAGEWMRAWVKGWDRLAAAAKMLPEIPFLLAGASPEVRRRLEPPANMQVLGPLAQEELLPRYQRASVYAQASRSEGLPNTLLEAMACGCVPVVTRIGGMPEAVQGVGFVVGEMPDEIADGIRRAMDSPGRSGAARERAASRFSLAERERGLASMIEEVLASSAP